MEKKVWQVIFEKLVVSVQEGDYTEAQKKIQALTGITDKEAEYMMEILTDDEGIVWNSKGEPVLLP